MYARNLNPSKQNHPSIYLLAPWAVFAIGWIPSDFFSAVNPHLRSPILLSAGLLILIMASLNRRVSVVDIAVSLFLISIWACGYTWDLFSLLLAFSVVLSTALLQSASFLIFQHSKAVATMIGLDFFFNFYASLLTVDFSPIPLSGAGLLLIKSPDISLLKMLPFIALHLVCAWVIYKKNLKTLRSII